MSFPPGISNVSARAKMLLDRYRKQFPDYQHSYQAATIGIDRKMAGYHPAFDHPDMLESLEGQFLEEQLEAAEICPIPETSFILQDTACRLFPYGCVSAKAYEYQKGKYYILLDTGTGDLFGNISALLFGLMGQKKGHYDFELDEQAVISKLWGLALIYYDFGFRTNNEALLYPHFYLTNLNDTDLLHGHYLAASSLRFFIFHEFGHIVDQKMNNAKGNSEDEYSADFFALSVMRDLALVRMKTRPQETTESTIEFSLLGCILALATIGFFEDTFASLEYIRGSETRVFPSRPDTHPSGQSRINKFLELFPPHIYQRMTRHEIYLFMTETFGRYSTLIKNGARPSPDYWKYQEHKLHWFNDQNKND